MTEHCDDNTHRLVEFHIKVPKRREFDLGRDPTVDANFLKKLELGGLIFPLKSLL